MFYENFSITRFLGRIEGDSVESILDTNGDFALAPDIAKNEETYLFYQTFGQDNDLYLLNTKDGSLRKAEYHGDDDRYYMVNTTKYKDKALIILYYEDRKTREKLETKLYYINLSDLDFK